MLKRLMTLLMILLMLGTISSCSRFGMGNVDVIDMPVYEPTTMPSDEVIVRMREWKEATGDAPTPIVVVHEGVRYLAFLPEDVKRLNQRLVLQGFMEDAIYTMHDNMENYVIEINKWKKLYYNRSMQLRNLQIEINAD